MWQVRASEACAGMWVGDPVSICWFNPQLICTAGFQISFEDKVSMRNCSGSIDMDLTKSSEFFSVVYCFVRRILKIIANGTDHTKVDPYIVKTQHPIIQLCFCLVTCFLLVQSCSSQDPGHEKTKGYYIPGSFNMCTHVHPGQTSPLQLLATCAFIIFSWRVLVN